MTTPMNDERLAEIREHGVKHGGAELWTLLTFRDELVAEVERLRAELAKRCDMDDCEKFREWLSGEKADADKRARQAETARDRLAEQVEIERGRGNGYANKVVRAKQVRVWHNEDGKGFVFSDDLRAALDGTEAGR